MASGTYPVPIESHPSGATVLHEGRCVGITPCEAPVTVTSRHLELVLDGFHPQLVDVGTEPTPWAAGNVLTLGIGMFVDEALGFDEVPNTAPVVVFLRGEDASRPEPWTRAPAPPLEPPPPMSAAHERALIQETLYRRRHPRRRGRCVPHREGELLERSSGLPLVA